MPIDIFDKETQRKYLGGGNVQSGGDTIDIFDPNVQRQVLGGENPAAQSDGGFDYRQIPYLGQFIGHAADAATMGIADMAQFLGAERLGNYLYQKAMEGEARLPQTRDAELSWDYISDPNGLASGFGQVAGSMLSMLAPTALVPGAQAATAAKVAQLGSKLPSFVGGLLTSNAPMASRFLLSSPFESMMEGGGRERSALAEGLSREEAARQGREVAAKNLALLGVTNMVGGAFMGRTLNSIRGAANAGSRLRNIAGAGAAGLGEAGINMYEEGMQEGISRDAAGQDYSYNPLNWPDYAEQWQAAKHGFVDTLPFGVAGMAGSARRNGQQQGAPTQEGEPPALQGEPSEESAAPLGQGIRPYNMPTQGRTIDLQVQNLKAGWDNALPQIGGILKDEFGMDAVISSGARSAEHNAEVGGAERSYHIDEGNGGDAVDIVLPEGTSREEAERVRRYFESTGKFSEVLFHDVGSGLHLHLGGLKGDFDASRAGGSGYDVNFNAKQNEAWREANWVSRQTGIPAEFIYRQWAHESANFTSDLARFNNNFGGLTQTTPNGEENKQPDGGNYYKQYANMHEYAKDYIDSFISRYSGGENINSLEDFANFLHDNGYYTDSVENYVNGMKGVAVPSAQVSGIAGNATRQEAPTTEQEAAEDEAVEVKAPENVGLSDEEIKAAFNLTDEEVREQAAEKMRNEAVANKDYEQVEEIQQAIANNDIARLREYLGQGQQAQQQAQPPAAKPKKAEPAPEIKAETKNLDAAKQKQSQKTNELKRQSAQNTNELRLQNDVASRASRLVSAPLATGEIRQRMQGQELLDIVSQNRRMPWANKVLAQMDAGLKRGLELGYPRAITKMQNLLGKAMEHTVARPPVQSEKAAPANATAEEYNNAIGEGTRENLSDITRENAEEMTRRRNARGYMREDEKAAERPEGNTPQERAEMERRQRYLANKGTMPYGEEGQEASRQEGNTAKERAAQAKRQAAAEKYLAQQRTLPYGEAGQEAARPQGDPKAEAARVKAAHDKRVNEAQAALDSAIAEREQLIDYELHAMQQELKDGGLVYEPNEEAGIGRTIRRSANPDWYRKFYKENGRKPNKQEMRDIAIDRLRNHYYQEAAEGYEEAERRVAEAQENLERAKRGEAPTKRTSQNEAATSQEAKPANDTETRSQTSQTRRETSQNETATSQQEKSKRQRPQARFAQFAREIDDASETLTGDKLADRVNDIINRIVADDVLGETQKDELVGRADEAIAEDDRKQTSQKAAQREERAEDRETPTKQDSAPQRGTQEQQSRKQEKAPSLDERVGDLLKNEEYGQDVRDLIDQCGAKYEGGKLTAETQEALDTIDVLTQSLLQENAGLLDRMKASISAWHGTQHDFDAFSLLGIGTGEGAQVHGWGLYFAKAKEVARGYRDRLRHSNILTYNGKDINELRNSLERAKDYSKLQIVDDFMAEENFDNLDESEYESDAYKWFRDKILPNVKTPGHLYNVEIPDADVMLDEDKKLSQQPAKVQRIIDGIVKAHPAMIKFWQSGGMIKEGQDYKKELTGKNFYDSLRTIMEAQGGKERADKRASLFLNKQGIKGITYEGGQDGRCYVVFDDEAVKLIAKFSKSQGDLERLLKTRRFLKAGELSARHKALAEFGREMGTPTIFFKADPRLHGYHVGGVTCLNVNGEKSLSNTFWHESFHWLANNNKDLYRDMLSHIRGQEGFSQEQIDKYREQTGRENLTNDEAIEEMLADAMPDVKQRVDFLRNLGRKKPSLAQRFVAWLKSIMDRFTRMMNNPSVGLTNTQRDAMQRAFTKLAGSMVDGRGRKIFRVNSDRADIRLADGRPLPSVKAKYSFAGERAENAPLKKLDEARQMEKDGKRPREIWDKTGWLKGEDDKWRFEIPDNLNSISLKALREAGYKGTRLADVYKNKKLYEAYPWLADTKIALVGKHVLEGGVGQHYMDDGRHIIEILDDAVKPSAGQTLRIKTVIVHEIQHAIQDHEGFARGGSPYSVNNTLSQRLDELEREGKGKSKQAQNIRKALKEKGEDIELKRYENLGGEQESRHVEQRALERNPKLIVDKAFEDLRRAEKKASKEARALEDKIDALKDAEYENGELTDEQLDQLNEYTDELQDLDPDLFEAYNAVDDAFERQEAIEENGLEMPVPHNKKVLIVFGGQASSKVDRSSDNAPKEKGADRSNRITLSDDGHIKDISLRYAIGKNKDARAREERRQREVDSIDPSITEMGELTPWENLLPERSKAAIRRMIDGGQTVKSSVKGYKILYNQLLSQYTESEAEEKKLIAELLYLRGAEMYAGTYGRQAAIDGRGNRRAAGAGEAVHDGRRGRGVNNANQINAQAQRGDNRASSMPKAKYSLSASDNSTPSFVQRLKNYFTGRKNPRSRREAIKQALEEVTGMSIRWGKVDPQMEVVVKKAEGVIRAKHAYDWEKLLPECGAAIADKLGLRQTDEMKNYIAKWLLTGAPNDTSQEARDFTAAMRRDVELSDRLTDIHEAFQAFDKLDIWEQAKEGIQFEKQDDTTLGDQLRKYYDDFVEELSPILRMEKGIEAKLGKKLSSAMSAMHEFRRLRGNAGIAQAMIDGNDKAVDALKSLFPSLDFTGFKTLHDILDSAGALHNQENMEKFASYAVAVHTLDIHKNNEGKPAEQQMKTIYTREQCEKLIAEGKAQFGEAQKDLVRFSNMQLAMLYDSGMISSKRYYEMINGWKNYVPLFREFEENDDMDFGDSLKHMLGSNRRVINPLESIVKNTFDFVKKAGKNKAKCKLANLARMSDVGQYVEEVTNTNPSTRTSITFYEGGKKKYLDFADPDIAKAVNMMGMESSNIFWRLIKMPTRIARACFVGINPAFAIRNVMRDTADATIYSKYGFKPWDWISGFLHAWRKDGTYYEWLASGAAQASRISLDRDYTKSALDSLMKTKRQKLMSPSTWLDVLQAVGEFSEMGTRIAVYEKTKKGRLAEGADMATAIMDAALESRDLMDFGRSGKSGRRFNDLVLFANASIQGWDKAVRAFDPRNGNKRQAWAAVTRLFLWGLLPTLALWLANHDDEEYKQMDDWQKEMHWIFKLGDKWIRIPKGQDIMLRMCSNLLEKTLDAGMDNKPLEMRQLLKPIEQALPDWKPTAFVPIIETWANYSFFRDRNIVPKYQEKLPEYMQYDSSTTSFAKWLGEQFGWSPKKAEHLIFGYTGNVGRTILNTYDTLAGNQQLNTAPEEMPILQGLMIMPYKNPKSVSDYYSQWDEQDKYHNEYKLTHKRPEGFDPALYARLKAAQKQMSMLNKRERAAVDDERLSYDQRRQIQEGIQQRRIALAKRALGER